MNKQGLNYVWTRTKPGLNQTDKYGSDSELLFFNIIVLVVVVIVLFVVVK